MQLKTQIERFLDEPFNCTNAQLQGLKTFIEIESGLLGAQGELLQLFARSGETSHTPNFLAWFDNHFDCSNQENVALRDFIHSHRITQERDRIQCI